MTGHRITLRLAYRATVVAAVAFMPVAGHAQTADALTREFPVVGTTPALCTLAPPTLADARMNNFHGRNGNAFEIDNMVSPVTLSTNAAWLELSLDGSCNTAHRVVVETENNGLWRTSEITPSAPAGFATAVPYTLDVRWGSTAGRLDANAGVRGRRESDLPVSGANSGEVQLRLEIQGGSTNQAANAPLVAGTYTDIIRVTLEPQQ